MVETRLTVLCWDHPRCVSPIRAACDAWEQTHPEVRFDIRARPLAAFNDQPIDEVAATTDLLFIDHPMVGTVATSGALAPFEDLIGADVLADLHDDSLGASQASYVWEGRQWALAVDAACQMSVSDAARLAELGPVPRTWDDVLALARRHPGAVGVPLYPSDAVLSLVSIAAELRAGGADVDDTRWPLQAVELLGELVRHLDQRSFDANPPKMLALMSESNGTAPVYVPLAFGYTNYQRPTGSGRRLTFGAPPTFGGPPSAVLGGAGLAVSCSSPHQAEAARFAAWMSGAQAQRDIVLHAEGQPSSRTVWDDPSADALVGGFFSGTRSTIESAYVRPRDPWWPGYQEAAGLMLARALRAEEPAEEIRDGLDRMLLEARDGRADR